MSSGAKHARHFGEEALEIWVLVRGFDIDHCVEGFVGEGQVFGVSLDEIQAGQLVALSAEVDAGRFRSNPV